MPTGRWASLLVLRVTLCTEAIHLQAQYPVDFPKTIQNGFHIRLRFGSS